MRSESGLVSPAHRTYDGSIVVTVAPPMPFDVLESDQTMVYVVSSSPLGGIGPWLASGPSAWRSREERVREVAILISFLTDETTSRLSPCPPGKLFRPLKKKLRLQPP